MSALAAGASLSALPADCDVRLLQHVVNLQPTEIPLIGHSDESGTF